MKPFRILQNNNIHQLQQQQQQQQQTKRRKTERTRLVQLGLILLASFYCIVSTRILHRRIFSNHERGRALLPLDTLTTIESLDASMSHQHTRQQRLPLEKEDHDRIITSMVNSTNQTLSQSSTSSLRKNLTRPLSKSAESNTHV